MLIQLQLKQEDSMETAFMNQGTTVDKLRRVLLVSDFILALRINSELSAAPVLVLNHCNHWKRRDSFSKRCARAKRELYIYLLFSHFFPLFFARVRMLVSPPLSGQLQLLTL